MPIEVGCEGCQKKLRIPDHLVGATVACPKCETRLVVPNSSPDTCPLVDTKAVAHPNQQPESAPAPTDQMAAQPAVQEQAWPGRTRRLHEPRPAADESAWPNEQMAGDQPRGELGAVRYRVVKNKMKGMPIFHIYGGGWIVLGCVFSTLFFSLFAAASLSGLGILAIPIALVLVGGLHVAMVWKQNEQAKKACLQVHEHGIYVDHAFDIYRMFAQPRSVAFEDIIDFVRGDEIGLRAKLMPMAATVRPLAAGVAQDEMAQKLVIVTRDGMPNLPVDRLYSVYNRKSVHQFFKMVKARVPQLTLPGGL